MNNLNIIMVKTAMAALALIFAAVMVPFLATADAETNSLDNGNVLAVAVANVADAANDVATVEPLPSENQAIAPVEEAVPPCTLPPVPDSAEEPHGDNAANTVEKQDDKATIPAHCRAKCPCLCWIVLSVAVVLIIAVVCCNNGVSKITKSLEAILLLLVLGLVFYGAYDMLNRLLDNLTDSNPMEQLQNLVDRPSEFQAAYAQLSTALQQWLTLFAILATFLGLVLPVGGHLLQIKELERKTEDVDRRIEGKIAAAEKKINEIWHQQISVCWWHAMQQYGIVRRRLESGWKQKYCMGAIVLFTWLSIISSCAKATSSDDEVRQAVNFIFTLYDGLKKDISSEDWEQFTKDVRERNKDMKLRIQIERGNMDKSSYKRLVSIAQEFGI